jgi:hypothetical protein
MALGGVAEKNNRKIVCQENSIYLPIGNIKASETANVQGRIRNAGCIPEDRA